MEVPTFLEWLTDLEAVAIEDQPEFIKETLRPKHMLHVFGRFFFPHIIRGEDDPPEAHLQLIQFFASPETGACLFPRGFAKSTWGKIDDLHDIVYALEPVMIYVSNTIQEAKFHFESIKGELENNEWLRNIYGDLVPDLGKLGAKWTNSHFETNNGVNMVARGAGKGRGVNIRNQRPTKIKMDDVENDRMVRSAVLRQQLQRWVKEVIIPSLDKERGRLKFFGTAIHPNCEVLRFYKANGGLFRRAIEEGKSIWPAMWSIEDLYKIRDGYVDEAGVLHEAMGTRAFNQEYQNDPINDTDSVFKRAWLDSWVWERAPSEEELREFFTIKMCVDPQSGEKEEADFLGVSVLGRDKRTGKIWSLYSAKFKGSINKQVEFIYGIYARWNPVVLGVEKLMTQTALYQLLNDGFELRDSTGVKTREKFYFRLIALSPKSKDKVERSKYVEPLVETGRILFNTGQTDLYDQLIEFPNGEHDDVADAFFYCVSLFEVNSVELKPEKSSMITSGIMTKQF